MTTLSDGTVKAASTSMGVRWRSSDSDVIIVDASGMARAVGPHGEAMLTAELTTGGSVKRSAKEVLVLPDGTFRMVGKVTEADSPSVGVADSVIETNPGGATTTTDGLGQYRIYGVPPDAEVRISATGYQAHVESLQLNGHATRNFQLKLSGSRIVLSGPYTLTIEAADGCPGNSPLPGELRRRDYQAHARQSGAEVDVLLTENRFDGRSYKFRGRTTAASATFTLGSTIYYYYYYYGPTAIPGILERFSNGTSLAISGIASTTGTNERQSGELDGVMTFFDSDRDPLGECVGRMNFTLARR
jgi:hypothetical protein